MRRRETSRVDAQTQPAAVIDEAGLARAAGRARRARLADRRPHPRGPRHRAARALHHRRAPPRLDRHPVRRQLRAGPARRRRPLRLRHRPRLVEGPAVPTAVTTAARHPAGGPHRHRRGRRGTGAHRLRRHPVLRSGGARGARPRAVGRRAPRSRLCRPAGRDPHHRGQLRHAVGHLLLRLDGHGPEGRRRAPTWCSPSCSTVPTGSSSRSGPRRGPSCSPRCPTPPPTTTTSARSTPWSPAPRRRWAGRSTPTGIRDLLAANLEHPRWDDVAERCLSCTNCTMVCPTCFCSTVEDVTDLTGTTAERWQRWDSCFSLDHASVHGTSVRPTVRSRYRQWLTHKLGTWHDQFGESGCVGCGRCITWCPVGIDLTEEVRAIRADPVGTSSPIPPPREGEPPMRTRPIRELLDRAPLLRGSRRRRSRHDLRLRHQRHLRRR